MESKMLTTQEVAEYFRVNPSIVTQKFCKEGLKHFKVSTTDFRYNVKDVYEFEESRKNQNTFNDIINETKFRLTNKNIKFTI